MTAVWECKFFITFLSKVSKMGTRQEEMEGTILLWTLDFGLWTFVNRPPPLYSAMDIVENHGTDDRPHEKNRSDGEGQEIELARPGRPGCQRVKEGEGDPDTRACRRGKGADPSVRNRQIKDGQKSG